MQPSLPKILVFVRHAIAIPREEFDGPDADRPLTKKGIAKARKVIPRLLDLYQPTRLVTSPYLRARDTANLILSAPSAPPLTLETCEAITPDCSWEDWRKELARLKFTSSDIAFVVGHEPNLGVLIARHLGLTEAQPLKKAGFAAITPQGLTSGTLLAFASPKMLIG
jgi:phosphohistidine phosphatase